MALIPVDFLTLKSPSVVHAETSFQRRDSQSLSAGLIDLESEKKKQFRFQTSWKPSFGYKRDSLYMTKDTLSKYYCPYNHWKKFCIFVHGDLWVTYKTNLNLSIDD